MKALIAAILMTLAAVPAYGQETSITGDWIGKIQTGAMSLRMAIHFGQTVTFDSLDQNALGLPATLARDGAHIVVEAPVMRGKFDLTLKPDGTELRGFLEQGGQRLPTILTRGMAEARKRPQTPLKPYPYREEAVSYPNPAAPGVMLAGSLTLPQGKGPFPAAVLITGSGSQDRDETLFDHKPFLVIADYLTRRGIAVLRVDDRGVGGSTGGTANDTSQDFEGDVAAGVAFLHQRAEIDPRRIGLIGHSEGGLIAPPVAMKDPTIAFVVMLAGPGVRGDTLIVEQVRRGNLAAGAPVAAAAANAEIQRRLVGAITSEADPVRALAAAELQADKEGLPPQTKAQLKGMVSPWYKSFLSTDPAPALRALKVPLLALNGDKDIQVSSTQNLPAIKAAYPRAETVELPGLNHLFQTSRTGAPSEYGEIEETFSPAALKITGDWILKTAAR